MPRSYWKGNISFGLVNIPVELFNTVDPASGISFKQINKKTGAKIKYIRVDSETEKEVTWKEIGKGYEYSKDLILPVGEDELKRVAGENSRTIAIEQFIDKKHIDFLNIEHAYYLMPDKKGEKGYVILREALKSSNKVGIAKVIISTKEYLAAVAIYEDALILYLIHYFDEIRPLKEFDVPTDNLREYKVTQKEIEIAKKLIHSMSGKWQPQKFKDEYKEAVEKWINAKIKKLPETKMQARTKAKQSDRTINFIDLLKKSLVTKKKTPIKHHATKRIKIRTHVTRHH